MDSMCNLKASLYHCNTNNGSNNKTFCFSPFLNFLPHTIHARLPPCSQLLQPISFQPEILTTKIKHFNTGDLSPLPSHHPFTAGENDRYLRCTSPPLSPSCDACWQREGGDEALAPLLTDMIDDGCAGDWEKIGFWGWLIKSIMQHETAGKKNNGPSDSC